MTIQILLVLRFFLLTSDLIVFKQKGHAYQSSFDAAPLSSGELLYFTPRKYLALGQK